jgi:4-amino-4-deoxy-L-arabinose transferase-like glycosyltransferase
MAIFKQKLRPRPAGPGEQALLPSSGVWARARALTIAGVAPELIVLIAASTTLNFWNLGVNRWANTYYSAAVRSMSTSWHNFLYASLDPSGVMSVDKPPLALWIEALSVRVFGYHPLSILIPEAVIGVATVVLIYDLVRRLFGRAAGLIAGVALATTPITVAMSRHNNPDALVALCCVAALWFFVRAIEDGRTRWIVLSGVMVGLGFETKMGIALVVVPGIVLAWLWLRPRGWRRAADQLIAGGIAMLVVGGAWPLLVQLTPAADRPWIAGTSNNNILSLIFGYNGLGRVAGQNGGPPGGNALRGTAGFVGAFAPAGAGGTTNGVFAGATGPFRLLNFALGGQAGWLLGVAIVGGLVIIASTRLRRGEPRSAWIVAVGGSFLVTAVIFSVAQGIFHPYYVSLLAPFSAALVGAGVGGLMTGRLRPARAAILVIAAGVASELVVLGDYSRQLTWIVPMLIAVGGLACLVLLATSDSRARVVALSAALAALLVAPSIWAVDTLGYATQSTFPAGGPAKDNAAVMSFTRPLGLGFGGGFVGGGNPPSGGGAAALFANPSAGQPAGPGQGFRSATPPFAGSASGAVRDAQLEAIITFVKRHGGGTIAVSSQSNAAYAIIHQDYDVAGIGGFSGRESDPTIAWFAGEVGDGRIRWVYNEGTGNFGSASDGRAGDTRILDAVARVCPQVNTVSGARIKAGTFPASQIDYSRGLFDCAGEAAALAARAG